MDDIINNLGVLLASKEAHALWHNVRLVSAQFLLILHREAQYTEFSPYLSLWLVEEYSFWGGKKGRVPILG